jgi:quercetin dioxygenase-like cupin family protein
MNEIKVPRRGAAMTNATATPVQTTAPSEGEAIWFNGAHITVKVPGAWSDEAFSLVEVTSTAGRATGLHTDPSHETFRVLEGELLFHVDGEDHRAGAGETVAIREGVPHAFIVVSDVARFLVMNTPGTQDSFFRDGGEPATDRDFATAPAPDLERTTASARAHGVSFIGPPPFDAARVRQTSG